MMMTYFEFIYCYDHAQSQSRANSAPAPTNYSGVSSSNKASNGMRLKCIVDELPQTA